MANEFRSTYRTLTAEENALMLDVKNKAQAMYDVLQRCTQDRYLALAKTKLEESVMWAVKGITG